MTTATVLRDESAWSLRIVRVAYSRVSQYPDSTGNWGQPPFPSFDALYEEFIDTWFDEKTSTSEIDKELADLHRRGEIDVENGFRDTEIGLNLQLEIFNTLLMLQCAFVKDGEVFNSPLKEVW